MRSLVVGSVCVLVSVAGHAAGGGAVPGVAGWLLLSAVCLAGAGVLSARRWTAVRLLVALVAAQTVAHVLLHLTAPSAAAGPPGSAGLALGHACAAVVLAVLLAREEAVLWRVVDLLLGGLLALWPGLPTGTPAVVPAGDGADRRASAAAPRSALVLLTAPRRGPPGLAFPLS